MARKPRLYYPGALYHVMLRGNGGQLIFFSDSDRKYFYHLLEDGINCYSYRVHAFCLMSNHVHLAIQVGNIPLSKIIQNLSFRYTRFINAKTHKIGHLFQGRYKAILVESDRYLKELVRYIHLNPIRAKITNNLDDYEWSSHKSYIEKQSLPWLTSNIVLNYFSNDSRKAIYLYKYFMCLTDTNIPTKLFNQGNQKGYPVLCEDSFLKGLSQNISLPSAITLEEIVQYLANHYKVESSILMGPSRNKLYSEIRMLTALVAIELKIASLTTISKYFNRDITAFIHLIKRKGRRKEINDKVQTFKTALQMSGCQA
jgi:putative transposase